MTQFEQYRKHYLDIDTTYPSVFALKVFLGNNPHLKNNKFSLKDKKICDIGFGDGRDLHLFHNLGMIVYGVEPDKEIVEHTRNKMFHEGSNVSLTVGTNVETGYQNSFFDIVYASGSIYYLPSEAFTIKDSLREANRILKFDGDLFVTFARSDSHVTQNAKSIDANTLILEDPYYNFRRGQRYHVYNNSHEIKNDLESSGFSVNYIADYDVDWFGTRETLFLCHAKKVFTPR